MKKHSMLAGLFNIPGNGASSGSTASVTGLQTRDQVISILQDRMGGPSSASLHFNPDNNSKYYFDIINESKVHLEAEGKEIEQLTRTTAGIKYEVSQDSAGNYLLRTSYDKIHLYTKKGDEETNIDAAKSNSTFDLVEKLLGLLKQTSITTTVSPRGEIKSVTWYQELTDKVMAAFTNSDINTQSIVKSRWEQLIEEGVMKKSVDQLFNVFPDSVVKVGDKWTLQSTQKGEISMNVTTPYRLEEISHGKAIITSESDLSRDQSVNTIMGIELTGDLKGQQTGRSEIDIKTGMLVKSKMSGTIKGKLQLMGREIPISIKNSVTMNRL